MALSDMIKKRQPSNSQTHTISPTIQFYNDCVEDYLRTARAKGLAKHGLILIPELIPIGQNTVLSFLNDSFFKTQFSSSPQTYYFVIMSLSIQAGIVFAAKWHSNYSGFKLGYAERVIFEGVAKECKPFLARLGLNSNEKENTFYRAIFERWTAKLEPYWKLADSRNYTFNAMLAAYQLGVSMILEKYGY